MLRVRIVLAIALVVPVFIGILRPEAVAADETTSVRIELQASMQRFIDRSVIDDAFVTFDLQSGRLVRYAPSKAHSRILVGDGFYVLCSDMRDGLGQSVPVDYYMTKAPRGYRVVRTEIANRGPLKALMKAGKLKTL